MIQKVLCRLHLHHRWQTRSTEDGGRYQTCTSCGRDRTGKYGKTINQFGSINMTGRPRRD